MSEHDYNVDPPNYRGPGSISTTRVASTMCSGWRFRRTRFTSRMTHGTRKAAGREQLEKTFVIYRPLTVSMLDDRPEDFWARELGDFNERVRIPHGQGSAPGAEGEPGNSFIARFTFIGSEAV